MTEAKETFGRMREINSGGERETKQRLERKEQGQKKKKIYGETAKQCR